jgi:hypothetical protein
MAELETDARRYFSCCGHCEDEPHAAHPYPCINGCNDEADDDA